MNDSILNRDNRADTFASLLILLYPCFKHLLPVTITLPLFILGSAILVLRHFRPSALSLWSLALVPLAWLSIMGELITGSYNADYIVFFLGILLFSAIAAEKTWAFPFVSVLLLMCAIHAVATIAFFLFPEVGESIISATPLSQYPGAWDYRSALTGSYSWNGMYIALGFVLCSAFASSRRGIAIPLSLLTILFGCALVLTTKRAHLLFSIVSFVFVYFISNKARGIGKMGKFILIAGAAIVLFLIAASLVPELSLVFERFTNSVPGEGEFLSGRTDLWKHAWEEWVSSPIIGHGWGSYRFDWIDGGLPVTSVGAHNVPLQLLAETGLVGLVTASVPCILLLKSLSKASSHLELMDARCRKLTLAAVSFVTFFLLYSMCGNPLYDSPMYLPLFAFYSIFGDYAAGKLQRERVRSELSPHFTHDVQTGEI